MKIKIIFNESKMIKKPGLRHHDRASGPKIIVIHHAMCPTPSCTYGTLKAKRISTHYEVDKDGTIYEYVDPTDVAYHAKYWNSESIGIDVTGRGGETTSAQNLALRSLVTRLCNTFSIPQVVAPDGIKYKNVDELVELGIGIVRHRNLRNTECPGDFPMETLGTPSEAPLEIDFAQSDVKEKEKLRKKVSSGGAKDKKHEKEMSKTGGRFLSKYRYFQKEHPNFSFQKFYSDLDSYVDGGVAAVLPKYGKDYVFGPEHLAAWNLLQKAKGASMNVSEAKISASILVEGRKENAAAMIVKKVEAPEVREYLVDTILNNIIVADPTPNKKYIEWAARRMADVARRQEIDDSNMDQYFEMVDRAKDIIESRARIIVANLKKYHKFAERNLMDKNIDKYKELTDWEHEIYKAEKEEREREEMKRREKGAKDTTDYLHDDDNYMIVRPRSEDSSCYYGRGTRWCISATQSRNYFDQYTGEGTGFYFVLFKHLPQDDVYKKLALVFTAGSEEPSEVFDVADDEVGLDAITEAARHNIFGETLKKSQTGQQIKKLKGPGRVESYKQAFNDIVEEYDDFIRTDSIEDKPSLQEIFLGLGLDEDDLTDDNADLIQEHLEELVYDQRYDIVGQAIGHFEDNPAGPTDADYDALYEEHKYDYLYVSYDMYDENRWYWDAGFSLDVTDIHEDLGDQDLDEVENVLRQILDDYYTYPDELDGYGSEISIRFQPDYDEQDGLNGFENFLNRMDDVDQALHKIMESSKEETINTFVEAGLIAGAGMTSLKERFDDLELESFDIDIEDRELSIYRSMDITVPIPSHLYRGLTDDKPSWQTANRGEISKSRSLQAFDNMIRQRQSAHSDELIEQIRTVFDQAFNLYAQKLRSALPGFEREPKTKEEYGMLIPEYNVGIYRKSGVPQVGPSGLMIGYFFDVRIEADEEESLEEENLKLIELFLRRIDSEVMIEKIQARFETIVQNDVVKNIIPQFKEGGDEPEMDPITGKVTSAAERAEQSLSNLRENKKGIKIIIKESAGSSMHGNIHMPMQTFSYDKHAASGKDTSMSAKAVLHRNGKVLLLLNRKGWDLPGGHIKEDEGILDGLRREVFEETGISIGTDTIKPLHMQHDNIKFFSAEFTSDDVTLSDEHTESALFELRDIADEQNISPVFKKAILKTLKGPKNISEKKLLVRFTQ